MHYVALLSGGKDSCFNLLHCAQHGHKLVAAASLGPEFGKGEIDSYLYQTVGQDAVQLVADALEVPLLRKVIRGTAIQQGAEYGSRDSLGKGVQGDETEDLFELLCEVKAKYPEVRGVSVGAIQSNYQRVRVENVCQRLSLTPLCYLWQRDQSELLSEMIETGLKAILIKVAGIGLTTRHLGKTLAEMQPVLLKLNSLYGAHVCGEGGEYESLTLDSPLFKHQIILEDVETVVHSDSDFATVAYLKVARAHLQKKVEYQIPKLLVPEPSMLSQQDRSICDLISSDPTVNSNDVSMEPREYRYWKSTPRDVFSRKVGPWVVVSNVETNETTDLSIEEELRACFEIVQLHLGHYALNLSHLANITMLIANMSLFPPINAAYISLFGVSPPARACVAVDLPSPTRVRLECIASVESESYERRSLHVQSLSYWAPANIGPYSQAITVNERIFVSGQIGLIPADISLPEPQSLSKETALSLRHVRSIADAVKNISAIPRDCTTQGIITWLTNEGDISAVKRGMSVCAQVCNGEVPTLFVAIKSLPKHALVESQALLHTGRDQASEEGAPSELEKTFSRGKLPGFDTCWEISSFKGSDASVAIVACNNDDDADLMVDRLACVPDLRHIWRNPICVRLFHTSHSAPNLQRIFRKLSGNDTTPCIMPIPSRYLATWARDSWDYALYIIA